MHAKPLASCRVFYLEDDYYLAEDTREVLAAAGAEVSLCASVAKAIDLVQHRDFDAALLDLNLAGESSVPVARNLRQAEVPVVFLTGYAREILPEDLSSCALLTKPSEGPKVVRELEQQLKLSGGRRARASGSAPQSESDVPTKR